LPRPLATSRAGLRLSKKRLQRSDEARRAFPQIGDRVRAAATVDDELEAALARGDAIREVLDGAGGDGFHLRPARAEFRRCIERHQVDDRAEERARRIFALGAELLVAVTLVRSLAPQGSGELARKSDEGRARPQANRQRREVHRHTRRPERLAAQPEHHRQPEREGSGARLSLHFERHGRKDELAPAEPELLGPSSQGGGERLRERLVKSSSRPRRAASLSKRDPWSAAELLEPEPAVRLARRGALIRAIFLEHG
jgi:hypothetical protein